MGYETWGYGIQEIWDMEDTGCGDIRIRDMGDPDIWDMVGHGRWGYGIREI